jgi:hypothetical protein
MEFHAFSVPSSDPYLSGRNRRGPRGISRSRRRPGGGDPAGYRACRPSASGPGADRRVRAPQHVARFRRPDVRRGRRAGRQALRDGALSARKPLPRGAGPRPHPRGRHRGDSRRGAGLRRGSDARGWPGVAAATLANAPAARGAPGIRRGRPLDAHRERRPRTAASRPVSADPLATGQRRGSRRCGRPRQSTGRRRRPGRTVGHVRPGSGAGRGTAGRERTLARVRGSGRARPVCGRPRAASSAAPRPHPGPRAGPRYRCPGPPPADQAVRRVPRPGCRGLADAGARTGVARGRRRDLLRPVRSRGTLERAAPAGCRRPRSSPPNSNASGCRRPPGIRPSPTACWPCGAGRE